MAATKSYIYRVYSVAGTYLGDWNDVTSEFSIAEELNSAGGQVEVHLARPANSFGEGVDVGFNYQVKIYCVDTEQPTGVLVFTGFISNYTPAYGAEELLVTLWGYGAELDDFMIFGGPSISQTNGGYLITPITKASSNYWALAQTFTITETTRVYSVDLWVTGTVKDTAYVSICSGTPSTYGAASALGGGTITMPDSNTLEQRTATLTTPLTLVAGTYFIMVTGDPGGNHGGYTVNYGVMGSIVDSYSGGALYQCTDVVTDPTQTFGLTGGAFGAAYDLQFTINAGTAQPYLSMDPSDIMRSILDLYAAQGGHLTYDGSTLESTGTTVSYTFNTNTVLEGIKKCLELAPPGWYFYIDQTTNKVHFHLKSTSVQRTFALGKDILTVSPRKTIENMVNTIYLTGGGTPVLFKKYTHAGSIALYGIKLQRYVDQRITRNSTADTIAATILAQRNAPEVQLQFEIVDSNVASPGGYDIELVTLGEVVGLRATGGSGQSFWDVAQWDVDFWDYNVTDLGTLSLQVVRLERRPASIKIFCSTVPPDVNKRIEDINRNLEATQTADNPSAPS